MLIKKTALIALVAILTSTAGQAFAADLGYSRYGYDEPNQLNWDSRGPGIESHIDMDGNGLSLDGKVHGHNIETDLTMEGRNMGMTYTGTSDAKDSFVVLGENRELHRFASKCGNGRTEVSRGWGDVEVSIPRCNR